MCGISSRADRALQAAVWAGLASAAVAALVLADGFGWILEMGARDATSSPSIGPVAYWTGCMGLVAAEALLALAASLAAGLMRAGSVTVLPLSVAAARLALFLYVLLSSWRLSWYYMLVRPGPIALVVLAAAQVAALAAAASRPPS
jgi:hypothetical protein